MLYGLLRKSFPLNANGNIKNWIDECKEHSSTYFGLVETLDSSNGLLVTLATSDGNALASMLYVAIGKPGNLIYVQKLSDEKVWLVFAHQGIIRGDYLLSINTLDSESQQYIRASIIQDVERFIGDDEEVNIYCSEVVENDDDLELLGLFKVQNISKYQVFEPNFDPDIYLSQDDSYSAKLMPTSELNFPIDTRIVRVGIGFVSILFIALMVSLLPESEPDPVPYVEQPPIIVDRFSHLTKVLTIDAIGIKQRFIFIVQDLFLAKQVKGWVVKAYTAEGDISALILNRRHGNIDDVIKVFPKSHYQYTQTVGGVKLLRQVDSYPVLHKSVRANIQAESVWLKEAIEWVWADRVEISYAEPVKSNKKHNFVESASTVSFEGFFLEDLDSLSSIYTGRSVSFNEIVITANEDGNMFSGEFKSTIIGVTNEYYGIKKR